MVTIHGGASLRNLLEQHPWAEEVLAWHRIDAGELDARMSLDAACWLLGRDRERVLADLWAAAPEDVPRRWREGAGNAVLDEEWSPVPTVTSFESDAYWEQYADDLLARPV